MSPTDIIIRENARRNKIFRCQPDQLSGRGCWNHTRRLSVPDYPIPVQYVNEATFNHPLIRQLRRQKSIAGLNKLYPQFSFRECATAVMLVRCQHDPWFAFAACFQIKHKTTGQTVPFILNHAQHKLLAELESERLAGKPVRLILLKARQWGGSTLIQLYMAWVQLFVIKGWNSVIIAQTKDTARRIKAMYRTVLEFFPADIIGASGINFAPKEGSTADSIIADAAGNDMRQCSISIASFENFESVRGAAFSMAHYSEVAYWTDTPSKNAAQVITNIDGGIAFRPLTMEVMESTANGMSGYFYDEYQRAKTGASAYKAIFIPFFLIEHDTLPFDSPDHEKAFAQTLYDERLQKAIASDTAEPGSYLWSLWEKGATLEHIHWYVEKRRGFHAHDQMASEAPSDDVECFRYSGANVFSPDIIERERTQFAATPLFVGDISLTDTRLTAQTDGPLHIWKNPDKLHTRHQYIVTVDVGGRSPKADWSVITVCNRLPLNIDGGRLEVVARWRGHLRYDIMARKAVSVARLYKNALLVFESNTFDLRYALQQDATPGTGDHIQGILAEIAGEYGNLYYRRSTSEEDIRQGIVTKIGFQTNAKTKQDMIDRFTVMFEDGHFLDPDARFYKEAHIYQQFPDGHYGNIPGPSNHDDILMTDMIACLVSHSMPPAEIAQPEAAYTPPSLGTINESYI